MNEKAFEQLLKRGGRSQAAIKRCIALVNEFDQFLRDRKRGKNIDDADAVDLESFVAWAETERKRPAKAYLWAIRYYYESTGNDVMRRLAGQLREQRIERKALSLKDFVGVRPRYVSKLVSLGIRTAADLLQAGKTPSRRQELSERAGIPLDAILELVKLSDLSRIFGVKGTRARLYHDSGVDTVEKMAQWDPRALRGMLVEFVERTGFHGIATLPKEAEFTVAEAKRLPKVVEY
jgi:predicted flap endonuclease-1-like 5' DNA nuclease